MAQREALSPPLGSRDDCQAEEAAEEDRAVHGASMAMDSGAWDPRNPSIHEDNWLRGMLEAGSGDGDNTQAQAANIIKVSLMVAFSWWGFGLFTVISTKSLAVLASLVDATIDLLAQGVLLGSNRLSESGALGDLYPVGVARLEPVGVVVCAVLMVLASGAVIYDSAITLVLNLPGGPDMEFTNAAQVMLAVVVIVKILVWRVAKSEYDRSGNVSLEALALDNFNDILSNAAALVFASLTRLEQATWWMDPIGAVAISCYIIRSWCLTALEQVNMLVGKQADPDFIGSVRDLAERHDPHAELRGVRAYHFGPKLIVEIELVMAKMTPLQVSHDVGVSLQDSIERLDECERCFVHIDYKHREHDLHDTNVPLEAKTTVGGPRRRVGSSGLRLRTVLSLRRTPLRLVRFGEARRGSLPRKTSIMSEPCPSRSHYYRRSASEMSAEEGLLSGLSGDFGGREFSGELWEGGAESEPELAPKPQQLCGPHKPTPAVASNGRAAQIETRHQDGLSDVLTVEGSEGSVVPFDSPINPL